jgi:serine protease Do
MKNSLVLTLAMAAQLMAGWAWAQGSGRNVQIVRTGGSQLGVVIEEVDRDVVTRLRLKEEKGALVTEVLKNSAAEKADIRKDDVIVGFQGESVLTAAQLRRLVREVPAGRKVDVDLVRGGAPAKVAVTLQRAAGSGPEVDLPELENLTEKLRGLNDLRFKSRDGAPLAFDFKLDPGGPGEMVWAPGRGRLGITYTEIEGQLARYFKAPTENAILVNSVAEGSAAEKAGMKAGDLLVKLGATAIEGASDLNRAVRDLEPGKPAPATVLREGRNIDLSVTVDDGGRTGSPSRRRRLPAT